MGNADGFLGGFKIIMKAVAMVLKEATAPCFFLLVFHPRVARGFEVINGNGSILSQRISIRTSMTTEMPTTEVPMDTSNFREEKETSSCYSADNHDYSSDGEGAGDHFSLLFPYSYPSKTFAASNVEVSYQPIESDDTSGDGNLQLLPLQKYHARNTKRKIQKHRRQWSDNADHGDENDNRQNNSSNDLLQVETPNAVLHDIPSLDFIYENLSRFLITKSSQVLLEEYHTYKLSCLEANQFSDNGNENENETTPTPEEQEQRGVLATLEGRLRSKIRAECRASLPLFRTDALKIIYCDSHICVVNKPSGVLSVPGHRRNPSLANLVYDTIQPASFSSISSSTSTSTSTFDDGSIDTVDQSVVHRLDMATSGIIVYALSKEALQKLHVTFRDRNVQKTYQALVEGHLFCGGSGAMEGEIDVAMERDPENPPYMRIAQPREPPIDESGGDTDSNDNEKDKANQQQHKQHKFWREKPKPSKTTWSILGYEHGPGGRPLTRVALKPHTGRTHQLRVHTSRVLGAPIVADDIYGSGTHAPGDPLCLHAHKLCIHHPITGAPMVFEADPPF